VPSPRKSTVKLTAQRVTAAKYAGRRLGDSWSRCVLWDTELKGFGLRVLPSGEKSFVLAYRHAGRKRLMVIGRADALSVDQARQNARAYLTNLASPEHKVDPLDARQKERQGETVRDLCAKYIKDYAPRKRTGDSDVRLLARFVDPTLTPDDPIGDDDDASRRVRHTVALKNRKVVAVTRQDLARVHGLLDDTPTQANRLLALFSKLFELAIRWGFVPEDHPNPARRIDRNKEVKRDRWIRPEELVLVAAGIDALDNVYARAALWLYLLTGARKSEWLTAKWADLDRERRELRIALDKAGRTRYLSLPPEAMAIVDALPRQKGNPYILCGAVKGAHLVNVTKPFYHVLDHAEALALIDALEAGAHATAEEAQGWRQRPRRHLATLRQRAKDVGLPDGLGRLRGDLRLHDARRTVGSWLAQSGSSLHLVGRVLGHTVPATTAIYSRFAEDHVKAALDAHAKRLLGVAGKLPVAEVVDIAEARKAQS
jgi:integrase